MLVSLWLASLGLAAPVPIVLLKDLETLEALAGAAHPPARVAAPAAGQDEVAHDAASNVVFDNRPLAPSPTSNPSAVLASVKPIETTYLLGLASRLPSPSPTTQPAPAAPPAPPGLKHAMAVLKDGPSSSGISREALKAVEASTNTQMEIGIVDTKKEGGSMPSVPCIYAHLSREYHDMLVISLVVAFLLVVIAVEMWETMRSRSVAATPPSFTEV